MKTANRKKYRLEGEELIEAENIMDEFIEPLKKVLPEVSAEAAIKLATAIHILRLPARY